MRSFVNTMGRPIAYVFDMDGVLVDTKEAVIQAYCSVGVDREDVINNWGLPWTMWVDKESHYRKTLKYPEFFLQLAKPLPHLALLHDLGQNGSSMAFILTAASEDAVGLVDSKFGILSWGHLLGHSMTPEMKLETLGHLGRVMDVLYFDDSKQAVESAKKIPAVFPMHVEHGGG